MKTYRVTLTIGRRILIEADHWRRGENTVVFLSGTTEVTKYYATSVEKIEECTTGGPRKPDYLRPGLPPEMK
jgi:hypothetical protein